MWSGKEGGEAEEVQATLHSLVLGYDITKVLLSRFFAQNVHCEVAPIY